MLPVISLYTKVKDFVSEKLIYKMLGNYTGVVEFMHKLYHFLIVRLLVIYSIYF